MKRIPLWLRWCVLTAASAAFAYSRDWTKLSLIPLGLFLVIGFARAFFAILMRSMSRELAGMTPEQRDKYFEGMSADEKRKLLAEYGIDA